jgi:hypothetical protein
LKKSKRFSKGGRENKKDFCKFCGSVDGLTPQD